jgi:hypothetical protein
MDKKLIPADTAGRGAEGPVSVYDGMAAPRYVDLFLLGLCLEPLMSFVIEAVGPSFHENLRIYHDLHLENHRYNNINFHHYIL